MVIHQSKLLPRNQSSLSGGKHNMYPKYLVYRNGLAVQSIYLAIRVIYPSQQCYNYIYF